MCDSLLSRRPSELVYFYFFPSHVSTAGVVVSCKIPILATRVRFPGGALFLLWGSCDFFLFWIYFLFRVYILNNELKKCKYTFFLSFAIFSSLALLSSFLISTILQFKVLLWHITMKFQVAEIKLKTFKTENWVKFMSLCHKFRIGFTPSRRLNASKLDFLQMLWGLVEGLL